MGARHVGESVDDGRLESLLGVVGSAVDYPLLCPPHVVVEGSAVGAAAGWPEIFPPEVEQVLFVSLSLCLSVQVNIFVKLFL